MKKLIVALGLVFGMAVMSLPAHATGYYGGKSSWICGYFPSFCKKVKKIKYKWKKKKYKKFQGSKPKHSVPEIDAAGAAISLALAAGVVSIMRERRKKA